jgi:hypothetical protein
LLAFGACSRLRNYVEIAERTVVPTVLAVGELLVLVEYGAFPALLTDVGVVEKFVESLLADDVVDSTGRLVELALLGLGGTILAPGKGVPRIVVLSRFAGIFDLAASVGTEFDSVDAAGAFQVIIGESDPAGLAKGISPGAGVASFVVDVVEHVVRTWLDIFNRLDATSLSVERKSLSGPNALKNSEPLVVFHSIAAHGNRDAFKSVENHPLGADFKLNTLPERAQLEII